ncbi:hypothetical protein DMN91_008644 [Ooceraea biroi]|uniref:Cell cycle checkpoint protein RAD17 n=1 Tax=Ooceraea biroi TaxID=2015173 RepID=A0A3L8DEF1_OOCBI|nr:hypothetical protein DMN91_008644 [Ooceraea biroi]
MTHSKKISTWCVSSFDCEITNKPVAKRTVKQEPDNNPLDRSFAEPNFKRRRQETSLSKLLEACEPQKSSELAVSRQKQNEISDWLQYRASKGRPSMLVLSGPSGCGKTAAMKLLAKENKFDVIEWITPIDAAEDENKRVMRQGERFRDHLIRATRYHTVLGSCSKQLLLVKDLPNVYQEDHKGFFELLEYNVFPNRKGTRNIRFHGDEQLEVAANFVRPHCKGKVWYRSHQVSLDRHRSRS